MRLRRVWLLCSLAFFAVFLTSSVIIILRGGDPIASADIAAEKFASGVIAPVELPGGARLLDRDESGHWRALADNERLPDRVTLLVHGLDEPGSIFDDLAPVLEESGATPIYFEYPNDQRIADSTGLLHTALRRLRFQGASEVDLVCHSMGGLVARDCLTRASMYAGDAQGREGLPAIRRWITVGTPYEGAPLADFRIVAEWREQAMRWTDYVTKGTAPPDGTLADGAGEAGEDLKPGSEFLTELNARDLPVGVEWTVIYGVWAPRAEFAGSLNDLGDEFGDGVVPVWSAAPDGLPAEVIRLDGNHRTMLKSLSITQAVRNAVGSEPRVAPAIPVILERLERSPGADGG